MQIGPSLIYPNKWTQTEITKYEHLNQLLSSPFLPRGGITDGISSPVTTPQGVFTHNTRMHSSRIRTAHTLPYERGDFPDWDPLDRGLPLPRQSPPLGQRLRPPPNRITDRCKNITLPKRSCVKIFSPKFGPKVFINFVPFIKLNGWGAHLRLNSIFQCKIIYIGPNFGDGLHFLKSDHSFVVSDSLALKRIETPFKFKAIKTTPRHCRKEAFLPLTGSTSFCKKNLVSVERRWGHLVAGGWYQWTLHCSVTHSLTHCVFFFSFYTQGR